MLTGKRFGKLTVLLEPRASGDGQGGRGMVALCRCECGTEREFRISRLSQVRSCGCEFMDRRRKQGGRRKEQDVSSGIFCPDCYDLPHRRPEQGPCKCGHLRAELPPVSALECLELCGYVSSIAECSET